MAAPLDIANSTHEDSGGGTSAADAVSITLTGTAAGTLIVVGVAWYSESGTVPTVSGVNDGNAYSSAGTEVTWGATSRNRAHLWYYYNASGGNKTITATFSSNNSGWRVINAASFTGVETGSDPKDGTMVSASGSSASASSGNYTNANAKDLLIGWIASDSTDITSDNDPIAWINTKAAEDGCLLQYLVVTTSAARYANATLTSNPWGASVIGFKYGVSAALTGTATESITESDIV